MHVVRLKEAGGRMHEAWSGSRRRAEVRRAGKLQGAAARRLEGSTARGRAGGKLDPAAIAASAALLARGHRQARVPGEQPDD